MMNRRYWRYVDHSTLGRTFDALQSFAYDDTFLHFIAADDAEALVRTWVHQNTVVLGIQDSRLPYIEDGLQFLQEKGYRYLVRNSGGLAVPLDLGILNVTLVLKETKGLSIDAAYEKMYMLIKNAFRPYNVAIDAYEIVGSYCPGSFDLSISGKKFAGISQRRIRGSVAVQIYLCVNGSGKTRAALMREFYRLATRGEKTTFQYPDIVPETMASLNELVDETLSINDVITRLLQTIREEAIDIVPHTLSEKEIAFFEQQYERLIKRNEKLLASES